MAKCRLFRKSQNSRHFSRTTKCRLCWKINDSRHYRQQRHSLAARRIPVALHLFHPAGLVYLRARNYQGRNSWGSCRWPKNKGFVGPVPAKFMSLVNSTGSGNGASSIASGFASFPDKPARDSRTDEKANTCKRSFFMSALTFHNRRGCGHRRRWRERRADSSFL